MFSQRRLVAMPMLFLLVNVLAPVMAQAHLMVAQHGTLNFLNNNIYMVLSLPVSAFEGVDENTDGAVSMIEFNNHRELIVNLVRREVTLAEGEGVQILHDIMLSPVIEHDSTDQQITQIAVTGRFALGEKSSALHFRAGLFGTAEAEQVLKISAIRKASDQRYVFELTPEASSQKLF